MQLYPRLSGYEIIAEIGQGAFATVYLGRGINQEYVAIKEISSQRLDGQKNKYLQKEITTIQQLIEKSKFNNYSRFLTKFYGFQKHGNYIYIISELCEFGDLYMHMINFYGQYTFEIKLEFLVEIIQGIQSLHEMGITHRDLKTDNILIAQDKKTFHYYLKISDFGISSLSMDNLQSKVGTVVYMAPEILSQAYYDYKVDIWSFGIIAFEIMKNQLYFPYNGDAETIKQIRQHTKYQRGSINDETIEDILDLCLRKDPKERPEAKEIKQMLMNLQNEISQSQRTNFQQPQQYSQQQQNQQQPQQFEQYQQYIHKTTSKILELFVKSLEKNQNSILSKITQLELNNKQKQSQQEKSYVCQEQLNIEKDQFNQQKSINHGHDSNFNSNLQNQDNNQNKNQSQNTNNFNKNNQKTDSSKQQDPLNNPNQNISCRETDKKPTCQNKQQQNIHFKNQYQSKTSYLTKSNNNKISCSYLLILILIFFIVITLLIFLFRQLLESRK
ncbi:hypothetical protein ABPG72_021059 [Tetrahymena utriculariae]